MKNKSKFLIYYIHYDTLQDHSPTCKTQYITNLRELEEESLNEKIRLKNGKLLRECMKVIGNVRFENGIGGWTCFVLLKFFLENFFGLFKPFLLQVCGYVTENFVFVHFRLQIRAQSSKTLLLHFTSILRIAETLRVEFDSGLVRVGSGIRSDKWAWALE